MTSFATVRALSVPISYLPRSGPVVRSLAPTQGRVRQRFRGGAVFELDLSDRIQAWAFVRRGHAQPMCRWISRRLKPGDLFVDVGANVGMVSFAVERSGARVVAFEPDPRNCERWRANQALNESSARLAQAAVGDGTEPLRFEVGEESGWGNVNDEGGIEVRQVRLDDEFPAERIAVLKIDVEGYEPAVLRGAQRLLSERRIDVIVCEMNQGFDGGREIAPLLASYGYRGKRITPMDSAFMCRA